MDIKNPTAPCETIVSAKRAINGKLQLRYSYVFKVSWGGVDTKEIEKRLLSSVWVNFLIDEYLAKLYKQERGCCLMHFARLAYTLKDG